jgi:Domain of unknown function (DUF4157)
MFAPKITTPQTKTTARSTSSPARQRSVSLAHPPSHDVGADHDQEAASPTVRAAQPGLSWDFGKMPIFPPHAPISVAPPLQPGLQRKLVVGQVNDPLEHEADHVADQVMRMPDASLTIGAAPMGLSRKCAACEEEQKSGTLQAHPAAATRAAPGAAPPIVHEVLRSPGRPLDAASRGFFEPRFGHSFGRVRIHTDRKATESARSVNALAYTVGRDVVMAEGAYAPGSASGRRLLAHELTHVIQQGNAQPTGAESDAADGLLARFPISTMQPSGEGRVQRQGLDPNLLFCAAVCAICAGTLVAPELLVPEIACALCVRKCGGGMAQTDHGAPGQGAPGQGAPAPATPPPSAVA